MMGLSIRARLTLWYTLVLLATLAGTALVLTTVHARLGLNRIDRGLAGNLVTATTGVDHEIDEGLTIAQAATDALAELLLPGSGVGIIDGSGDGSGRVVGVRASGLPALSDTELRSAGEQPVSLLLPGGAVRALAGTHRRRDQTVRLVVWTTLAPLDAERATVRRTLWIAVPIGLLFAAVGGWIVGWRSLAPLSNMVRQVNVIDDRRLDSRLVVPDAGDELGALAVAFNSLLERLAVARQAQRRFMADASHQLRTPLSIARTAAQVTLGQRDRPDEEFRDSLATVALQTERMTRMVDDMFTLALADLDGRPLQLEEVYLDEIVTECVAAARILAREREVEVLAETPHDVQMRADQSLIRQMILNLVENAIRHTPLGGTVRITLDVEDGRARIAVSDTGIGIPASDRERIFERFVRLEPSGSRGGGGLGLPIARWVAELHGGGLTLEATGPEGSRFVAVMPLR